MGDFARQGVRFGERSGEDVGAEIGFGVFDGGVQVNAEEVRREVVSRIFSREVVQDGLVQVCLAVFPVARER